MNPPHTGYELVPDKYKAMYKDIDVEALCAHRPDIPAKGTEMGNYFRNNIRNYYACITGVDEQVGRIIETLKSNGLFENTIVVFTSDHGICMGAHNNAGKDIFYEESMRIPMIISWPAKIKPRKDDHLMIAFADLYPSLLSLMGFQKEIPETVQTFDLSRHILGKNKKKWYSLIIMYSLTIMPPDTAGYVRQPTHSQSTQPMENRRNSSLRPNQRPISNG